MKIKHLRYWLEQTLSLSELSECSRRKFGAIIIDPESNVALVNGYNGAARGGFKRCESNTTCARDTRECESGTRLEIGCNHAEANAIANAARIGLSTLDKWLIVNGEPCLACAKLIHQSGISRVVYITGVYSTAEGVKYLKDFISVYAVDLDDETSLERVLLKPLRPSLPIVSTSSPFAVSGGTLKPNL
jgi:dCMP deaminase